jgi:hypothetical protein
MQDSPDGDAFKHGGYYFCLGFQRVNVTGQLILSGEIFSDYWFNGFNRAVVTKKVCQFSSFTFGEDIMSILT